MKIQKNLCGIISLFFIFCAVLIISPCVVVYAGEDTVKNQELVPISADEINFDDYEWFQVYAEINEPLPNAVSVSERGTDLIKSSSTEKKNVTEYFEYTDNVLIAYNVEIWLIDGKVHIYSRTITYGVSGGYSVDVSYGNITNTDGTVSYIKNDKVTIKKLLITQYSFTINFTAYPDRYSYSVGN